MSTIVGAPGGGNWSVGASWVGGVAPTDADDVLLVLASGNITVDVHSACASLDCTGYTGTLTVNQDLQIGASGQTDTTLKLVPAMTLVTALGHEFEFAIRHGTASITLAGHTIDSITFNSLSDALCDATWDLLDGVTSIAAGGFALWGGTLKFNGHTHVLGAIQSGGSASSDGLQASDITYDFGACNLTADFWTFSNGANGTISTVAGTASITLRSTGGSNAHANRSLAVHNLTLTAPNGANFPGGFDWTFNDLTITGTAVVGAGMAFTPAQTYTINGTFTVTGPSDGFRCLIRSTTVATPITIDAAATALTNVDFQSTTAAGAAAWTGARVGNAWNNTGITFDAPRTLYWVGNGGSFSDSAHWSLASGGASGAPPPLPQDTVLLDAASVSAAGQTISINTPRIGPLDMSGLANNPTVNLANAVTCVSGSWKWGAGMTVGATVSAVTFLGSGANTITSNGKTFPSNITVGAAGSTAMGSWSLADNLFWPTTAANRTIALLNGTFDASGFNVQAGILSSSDSTGTARTLNMGSGTWTLYAAGNVILITNGGGLTLNANTSTVVISNVTVSTKALLLGTLSGGPYTFHNLTFPGGGGNVTINKDFTVDTLTIGPLKTVIFSNGAGGGSTVTVNTAFNAVGTAGNVITMRSAGAGTPWNIVSAGVITCDWLSLKDSHASGGAVFNAGANSIDVSGNTGWRFYRHVTPTFGGSSTFVASVVGYRRFTGLFAGSATFAATVKRYNKISATFAGTSSLVVTVRALRRVTVAFAGTSSFSATTRLAPPVLLVSPIVSGIPRVGMTLTTSDGSWNPAAPTFTYQWQHSADGVTWVNIPGETSTTHLLHGSDFDKYVRCVVTATNLQGSTDAASGAVGPIASARRSSTTLGCGTYDVYILDRGGATIAVLDFPWNELSWSRVLDDTSDAHVAGAAADCFPALAGIEGWKHEVAIYRDGDEIWVGPLRSPESDPNAATPSVIAQLNARDLSAWWDRRVIHNDYDYSAATDLATIFQAFANDAMAPDNSPGLTVTASPCGVTGTRVVLETQYLRAAGELRSLSDIGVDWTIVKRQALVGGATVPTAPLATLTDEHFMVPPIVNRDGTQQGNRFILVGKGVDSEGGQSVVGDAYDAALAAEYGLLEVPSTDQTVTDTASAQAGAESDLAIAGQITSIENAILAPNAPVTVDELIPGAVCQLELTKTNPPVSGPYRLQRVSGASSQANPEIIVCTFQPQGTT